MKPNTRLTSAVFQLTPTRTRCDLIIIANDKKEKIASGLLSPFLAHLKTAQDQVSKGGYSIFLVPETEGDAAWFTKATLERFVRFVSTPEILERVYMIETEILQIVEAIAVQSSNNTGQNILEDQQRKPTASCEGNRPASSMNEEKAIVLYKPGEQLSEDNGSHSQEGNSKVELLKVMETRKTVLQKEQGMAFARAVAAGFDIDQIPPLLSFAECFQALRLMDACSRFIALWRSKHETGQWLDIEAPEELSPRGHFSTINSSSDIILSTTPNKHDISNRELASDITEQSPQKNVDNLVPNGQQAYLQGQYPHQFVPPWAMHAPPGAQPIYPAYPVQGMPYYPPGYTGNGQYFQPPHNPMEHSPSNFVHQPLDRRQSMDGINSNIKLETWELDRTRSLDDMDGGVSHDQEPRKRSGGSSNKKQAGVVVIRNINYITSKEKEAGSVSNSGSDGDSDNETSQANGNNTSHFQSKRSLNSKGSVDEASKFGKDADDGHWKAFQNCLLRGNDDSMFAMEKDVNTKRRMNTVNDDSLALGASGTGEIQDNRVKDIRRLSAAQSRRLRGSGDDALLSRADNDFREDIDFGEINGRNVLSRTNQEDIMIGSQHKLMNSSDPLALNSFEGYTNKMNKEFSNGDGDEAFIIPYRSTSTDLADRTAIDIESEILLAHQKSDTEGNRNRVSYEPDGLSLMPERRAEKRSPGYEHSIDYEMQVFAAKSQEKGVKDGTDVKQKLRKSDKDMSSKVVSGSSNKQRNGGPIRKGRSSKMTPLEDARARAESLRSYKADLQKQKREKEEAEARRLAALKLERQKRIAAKGSLTAQRPAASFSPQTKQLTSKLSPATSRGTKFTDAEPGSSSPLQRSKVRISNNSSELSKISKAGKLSEGGHVARNRLTRSSSSLSETKKESNGVTPDSKTSMARIRRLSEPKVVGNAHVTSIKSRSAETVVKRKVSVGPERNKVSAMVHLDRSKAETLPELKIKMSKSNAVVTETKSAVKDVQSVKGKNHATSNAVQDSNLSIGHEADSDENPIIEKVVVMLEYEKPSHAALPASVMKSGVESNGRHQREKSNVISGFDFIRGIGKDPNTLDPRKQLDPIEVKTTYSQDPPNNPAAKKGYQAPYARVSSLKDPSVAQPEYSKAPIVRSELVPRVQETVNAHVLDVKTVKADKNTAGTEKTHVKDLSNGLRRLLKFGKKNQASSVDQSVDSECKSVVDVVEPDNNASSTATSQGHMLKNLISQDETSNAGDVTQKTSRHFSLFSPFRSKTSEKKQAT